MIRSWLLITTSAALACAADAPTPRLTINATQTVRELPRFTGILNTSTVFAPPLELAGRVVKEYGRPRLTRCWLQLDEMWDYRDDTFHFNFKLGPDRYKGDPRRPKNYVPATAPPDYFYYDYMDRFTAISDEVLLNVRRYEKEVVAGAIPMAKWKQMLKTGLLHYKKRYPNIRYIEALNEYHLDHFGGLNDDQYYDFYRSVYQAVNEVNDELQPAIPLLVGGPNVTGKAFAADDPKQGPKRGDVGYRVYKFFEHFAKDPDPRKRLDFLSFHDWALENHPAATGNYVAILRGWLRENGLNEDLPLFDTEIGWAPSPPKSAIPARSQRQATLVSTAFYVTRADRQITLFPWVLVHNPRMYISHFILMPDGRLTPFGAALKMWAMQKKNEVALEWEGRPDRAYAIATTDGAGIAVQAWNDADGPVKAEAVLAKLPEAAAGSVWLREYRVDASNSNCLLDPASNCELAMVKEEHLPAAPQRWNVALDPHSLVLWTIEPAPPRSR